MNILVHVHVHVLLKRFVRKCVTHVFQNHELRVQAYQKTPHGERTQCLHSRDGLGLQLAALVASCRHDVIELYLQTMAATRAPAILNTEYIHTCMYLDVDKPTPFKTFDLFQPAFDSSTCTPVRLYDTIHRCCTLNCMSTLC